MMIKLTRHMACDGICCEPERGNQWTRQTLVKRFMVSTTQLPDIMNKIYETMTFPANDELLNPDVGCECCYITSFENVTFGRHKTQERAIEHHENIIDQIISGEIK